MHLRFHEAFDGPTWPATPAGAEASLGEAWLGPEGLLSLIETQLGLDAPRVASALRAAQLVPAIRATDGFWSRSAQADPFGVARTLLAWRDQLWLAGWRGQGVGPRTTALASVLVDALPGTPDRVTAVTAALATRSTEIEHIELLGTRLGHLAPAWRDLFYAIARRGTVVEERDIEAAAASGDLAACLAPGFRPEGDGSLQLLRPAGPQVAAQTVAAWLADRDRLESTVIIGGDATLDAALASYGLPRTGAASADAEDGPSQVLRLVLEMAWRPQDPQLAAELLLLPAGPLPGALSRRLAKALQAWPAVDSPAWREALTAGLARIEDDTRRENTRRRYETIFTPRFDRGRSYSLAEIDRRAGLVGTWLQARAHAAFADAHAGAGAWDVAAKRCAIFIDIVHACGLTALGRGELQRALAEAVASVQPARIATAEVGLARVDRPAAIAAPVDTVVWWRFTRASAESPQRPISFGAAERSALEDLEVRLPRPAEEAQRFAQGWRRPFEQAQASMLAICPRREADGEEASPHPVWDEIQAGLAEDADIGRVSGTIPRGLKAGHLPPMLAIPRPRRAWQMPEGVQIARREAESASSLDSLLGCPLHWVLNYTAKLRSGHSARLPEGALVRGMLAHELLERVLLAPEEGNLPEPEAARLQVEGLFDSEGPRLFAAAFLPGHERERDDLRWRLGRAAAALVEILAGMGAKIAAAEELREGHADPGKLRGYVDLTLADPLAIIDMKWSGESYRRAQLEAGAALQLAIYAYLLRDGTLYPPAAYFIVNTARLVTTSPVFDRDGALTGAPGTGQTFRALETLWARRQAELDAGRILAGCVARGDEKPPKDSRLHDNGELVVAPPTAFCPFQGLLCGDAS